MRFDLEEPAIHGAVPTRIRLRLERERGPRVSAANLDFLRTLAESGAYKPVIDRTYPLARIADAHAHVDTGRKRGNVVIAVA